jgi:hypothetical protein
MVCKARQNINQDHLLEYAVQELNISKINIIIFKLIIILHK